MALVDQNNIRIVKGEDNLSLYQFHTNTAKHYFCSVCGIYTHHHTRRNTSKCGINVACIDDINPEELKNIRSIDGKNHDMDKYLVIVIEKIYSINILDVFFSFRIFKSFR